MNLSYIRRSVSQTRLFAFENSISASLIKEKKKNVCLENFN